MCVSSKITKCDHPTIITLHQKLYNRCTSHLDWFWNGERWSRMDIIPNSYVDCTATWPKDEISDVLVVTPLIVMDPNYVLR